MMNRKMKVASFFSFCLVFGSCGIGNRNDSNKDSSKKNLLSQDEASLNHLCRPELRNKCNEISTKIKDLKEERKKAIENDEEQNLARLNMDISFRQELLSIYRQGVETSHPDVEKLHSEYDILNQFLASHPLMPYSPSEKQAVAEIFKEFGHLYIKASPEKDGKAEASVIKFDGEMPWASYWYPKRFRYLFESEEAPLAKLDKVLANRDRAGNTALWEKEHYNDFSAEWEGLCDAWALAAIQTKEPQSPVNFHGVTFSISDLKALTIKMFEGMNPKIYGNRYLGDYSTDGEIQDLRPEAFHKLAVTFLDEKNQLIAVDDDPGPEVWAKPFYHMRWVVTKDPANNNAFLVRAWPRLVDTRNTISNELTKPIDIKAPVYSYRLYIDPNQTNEHGEFKVIYGEWIEESKQAHPDMVFIAGSQPDPTNKELAKNLDVLKELLVQAKIITPEQFTASTEPTREEADTEEASAPEETAADEVNEETAGE